MVMCNLGNCLKVRDKEIWVANALDVNGFRILVNGRSEISWFHALNKLGCDVEAGKEAGKLGVCAAV